MGQQNELQRIADRAAKLHGLIKVRKTTTDKKFFGVCLYDRLAPASWQGYPVALVLWGNPEPSKRERWGPFCNPPSEGKTYAEDLEKKVLSCLGLDKSLAQQEPPKAAQAAQPTATLVAHETGDVQSTPQQGGSFE